MNNPFAIIPMCLTCDDLRSVAAGPRASKPCPVCGCTCPKPEKGSEKTSTCDGDRKLTDLKHQRFRATLPGISLGDLTEQEKRNFEEWRKLDVHELDCLRYIEAGRYDPGKDPEFVTEARERFKTWRAEAIDRHVGPEPEWLRLKLAGKAVETNRSQDIFYEAWLERYGEKKP